MFILLDDAHGRRILEVGCGEGVASVQMAYRGLEVLGVDLSPAAVEVVRRRAGINKVNVDFRVCNIEQEDLGFEEFDVIWCDLVLHHVVPNLRIVMERI